MNHVGLAYWKSTGYEKDCLEQLHTYPEVRYIEKNGLWLGVALKIVTDRQITIIWRFE